MKSINLKSLVDIYRANGGKIDKEYLSLIGKDYNIEIKENELDSLESLVCKIEENLNNNTDYSIYNYFYLGYKIPQIGKEFDLLRISEDMILNIEYTREIPNKDKIEKQLNRNKYYINFLGKHMVLIAYVQLESKLYILDNNYIRELSFFEFINILKDNKKCKEYNLNKLFKTSYYLISPFNKTDAFMDSLYFLTEQQENIEKKIIVDIENGKKSFVIQGDAGTGKTLLVYDMAKKLVKNKLKVNIIHCGFLNNGHLKLIDKYEWGIFAIKHYKYALNKNIYVIIIDEVQRIRMKQFNEIIEFAKDNNIAIIICGDRKQIINMEENGIFQLINEQFGEERLQLTKKIRTNRELANFISVMWNLNKYNDRNIFNNDDINITYFNTYKEANDYIISRKGISYIPFTPTLYPQNGTVGFEFTCHNENSVGVTHQVIGQEFENVCIIIDKHFYYGEDKKLNAIHMVNNVYPPLNMLYQAITRVIQSLDIVVVDNIEIFNQIVNILGNKNTKQ